MTPLTSTPLPFVPTGWGVSLLFWLVSGDTPTASLCRKQLEAHDCQGWRFRRLVSPPLGGQAVGGGATCLTSKGIGSAAGGLFG